MKYRVPKHTPGPWKIIDHDEDHITITDIEQEFGVCVLEEGAHDTRAQMMADARLIAAAPSMLEFLQGMLSSMARPPGGRFYVFNITPELYDDLNARIVKAIGGVE